ncbi:hypothetical protein [Candidatus Leptofilum sp.]|uniref:hypothetical protein n=1 Tax=Candidatus Leptofilum sp. TaxID=3241576 RepID=UPI003B5BEFF2
MKFSDESEIKGALIGIAKNLKVIAKQQEIIAEQQKRQTDSLRNLSAVSSILLIMAVLPLLIMAAQAGILS